MRGRSIADALPVPAAALVGLVSFAYLLTLPPTLNPSDESFLLYGAKRILDGQALYRDFFDFIAPGTFYLYTAAYAVGGVSITTARVTTALLNAAGAACTYLLALRVAAPAEALLASLVFTVACAAAWNLATHHWVATTFGLAAAAVLLAPRWRGSSRGRPAIAGALAACVLCSHQGRGMLLLPWLAVAVPALALARGAPGRWRRAAREVGWTAAGGAAVCLLVLGYAVWRSSVEEIRYATHEWVVTSYRQAHVGRIGWGGALWKGGLLEYPFMWLVYAVPVILGVDLLALLVAIRRHGLAAELVRALLLLLAILMAASILYFPDYVHVLFITPFALVVLAGLVYRARAAVRWRAGRIALGIVWVVLLVAVAAKGWRNADLASRANPVRFATAYGTLAGDASQPAVLQALHRHLGGGGAVPRLFSYPTDAWLYLALPADNPTPFALLRPGYNTPQQIATAMHRLEQDPQAAVVVNMLWTARKDRFLVFLGTLYREVTPLGAPFFRLFVPRREAARAKDAITVPALPR